jgi:hypothetical protein
LVKTFTSDVVLRVSSLPGKTRILTGMIAVSGGGGGGGAASGLELGIPVTAGGGGGGAGSAATTTSGFDIPLQSDDVIQITVGQAGLGGTTQLATLPNQTLQVLFESN